MCVSIRSKASLPVSIVPNAERCSKKNSLSTTSSSNLKLWACKFPIFRHIIVEINKLRGSKWFRSRSIRLRTTSTSTNFGKTLEKPNSRYFLSCQCCHQWFVPPRYHKVSETCDLYFAVILGIRLNNAMHAHPYRKSTSSALANSKKSSSYFLCSKIWRAIPLPPMLLLGSINQLNEVTITLLVKCCALNYRSILALDRTI